MAHLGTLRDYRFEDQADDIRGCALYGRDNDKLGKIDDVIFDHASGALKYVIVDSGGWLGSKKFVVPSSHIRPRAGKEDEYTADLSRKQVESFPVYNEDAVNDQEGWGKYERDYRRASGFEETAGVLHQAGSTNILVPDNLPAEGPAPRTRTGQPVSGYKSPIHHREAGMMDTTPIGVGQNANDERLTFVPDALGTDRGDVKDTQVGASERRDRPDARTNTVRRDAAPPILNRYDDSAGKGSAAESTIEGDAIFNAEDVAGRTHQRGNVHDADVPSYATVGGAETETSQGRLPNYPDASQGQRWARFEENLRRQRPKIVSRCNLCDELQNRRREDVA